MRGPVARNPWWLAVLALAAFLALDVAPVDARLGGGQSYRSSSRSSGSSYRSSSSSSSRSWGSSSSSSYRSSGSSYRSSGSSSGARLTGADLLVIFGILTVCTLVGVGVLFWSSWSTGASIEVEGLGQVLDFRNQYDRPPGPAQSERIAPLRSRDPTFSRAVFLDLVHSLFVRYQEARGHRKWEPLRPFLSRKLFEYAEAGDPRVLGTPACDEVKDVVVGSIAVQEVRLAGVVEQILVRIRANRVEVRGGRETACFVEVRWTLERPSGTRSPTPEAARTLGCPACGATVDLTPQGECRHCGGMVAGGKAGWTLARLNHESREVLPPLGPGGHAEEAGTSLPTRSDPLLGAGRRKLTDRHPGFDWKALEAFAAATFLKLQAAWSAQDARTLRGLETDMLYGTHAFWLERYKKSGLSNRLEDPQVKRLELVAADADAWYESVTFRIHASGKDVTLDASGKLVGGRRDRLRTFTEYWTFLRSVGAEGKAPGDPSSCPACGAPRDRVSEAGVCEYCDSTIVTGKFDWVLALIEQDEEYEP